ncbi:MAG: hypothetical protein IKP31_06805 [Lachnospiraceae bacterium]|nr:hypothetical protein [Lachnospiraceae bacterium]
MALQDEINQETKKLKDMPPKKKAEYIWEYYKFHIIGTIAAIIFICVFIRDWRENKKPVFLDMIVINSDIAYTDDNPLRDDFIKYAGIDMDMYNLSIDTSFVISDSGMDQLSLANSEKLMAMFAAGTIDLLLGPDDLINEYGAMNAYKNMDEVFTPEIKAQLEKNGYEVYYATVYEEDENGNLYPEQTFPAGIYLDNSGYLNSVGGTDIYKTQKDTGKRPVLAFAHSIKNMDNALLMLKMLTGI